MSGEAAAAAAEFEIPEGFADWQALPPAPWRRYGARALDIAVSGGLGWMFLGLLWYLVAPLEADAFFNSISGEGGQFVDIMLTVMMSGFLNALSLSFVGSTLGKAIFGIKVLPLTGNRLSLGAAFMREFNVWVWGLGLGIPILTIIANVTAYNRLASQKTTSWDKGRFNVIYRKSSSKQTMLNILGIAVIVAARVGFVVLAAQS